MIIDTPETKPKLQNGQKVAFLFKETEVVITKGYISGISMQNKISGKIIEIQAAPILSKVSVQTALGPIQAIITTHAVKQLDLKVADKVVAMVKTNEMMLSL